MRRYPLFLLLLIISILSFVPYAHAVTPSLVSNTFQTCVIDPCTVVISPAQSSEIIVLADMVANGCVTGSLTMTDTLSNVYVQQQFVAVGSGGGTQACIYALAASNLNSGSDTITIHGCGSIACSLNILDYSFLVGLGASSTFTSASASGTDTRTISVASGSLVIGAAIVDVSGVTCGTVTAGSSQTTLSTFSCQTVSAQGSASGKTFSSAAQSGPTYGDTVSWTGGGGFGRFVMELQGPGSNGSSNVSQCYGNCGVPPITLANTNSTHSINFNSSTTLFYRFQSNLNGFLNNVTVSSARVQPQTMTLTLGAYLAPNCGTGTPFTPDCPGFLQSSHTYGSLIKQRYTITTNLIVHMGDWIGISVTGNFAGLDLNDTNGQVPIYYTSGSTPGQIGQSALYSSTSKIGLWGWITGNIITGPTGPTAGCQTVTCGLQAFWIALGGDLPAGVAAFIVIFGLIGGSALYMTRQHDDQGHIKGFALPMGLLEIIALLLLVMLSAAGVLPAWIPLTIIIIAAGSFAGIFWVRRSHQSEA